MIHDPPAQGGILTATIEGLRDQVKELQERLDDVCEDCQEKCRHRKVAQHESRKAKASQ